MSICVGWISTEIKTIQFTDCKPAHNTIVGEVQFMLRRLFGSSPYVLWYFSSITLLSRLRGFDVSINTFKCILNYGS